MLAPMILRLRTIFGVDLGCGFGLFILNFSSPRPNSQSVGFEASRSRITENHDDWSKLTKIASEWHRSSLLRRSLGQPISLVLFLALVLRLALPISAFLLVQDLNIFRSPDSDSYQQLADALIYDGKFAIGVVPEIVRTPGYPIVMAPGIFLGSPDLAVISIQIALSVFTGWITYWIALRLTNSGHVAIAAAAAVALEPLSILYASKLLSETAFTFALILGLLLLVRAARRPGTNQVNML